MTIKILSCDVEQTRCEILIEDLDDCQRFAGQVASLVTTPLAIALSGTLGAGKTQWTRFFAIALGALPTSISSPTFMLVHEYASKPPIYHLDAYRIGDEDEMLEIGVEEMFDADAITVVEWSDRFPRLLPRHTLCINFESEKNPSSRRVQLQANGERIKSILRQLVLLWS